MARFLERLASAELAKLATPQSRHVAVAITRLLPFLAYGSERAMAALTDFFEAHLDWTRAERALAAATPAPAAATAAVAAPAPPAAGPALHEATFFQDCFVLVVDNIPATRNGAALKEYLRQRGVPARTAAFLLEQCPPVSAESVGATAPGGEAQDEWRRFLERPLLPQALRALQGLCRGHAPTQDELVHTPHLVLCLHQMELLTSTRHVGTLSEALLDALGESNAAAAAAVAAVRAATRERRQALARSQREATLRALGFTLADTQNGGRIVSTRRLTGMEELDSGELEEAPVCVVCREGYRYKPTEPLGVYTYTKAVPIETARGSAATGYLTVSHLNAIHISCHEQAVRADRNRPGHRDIWEGATLRNSDTLCNNLLPMLVRGSSDTSGPGVGAGDARGTRDG